MTLQHLTQAIQDCNNGNLDFNLGEVRAFLFENKWFPLRATINRAAEYSHENNDLTTDRALVQLVYLGMWTRIKDAIFLNQLPIALNDNEKLIESNKLSQTLLDLTNIHI